MRKRNLLLAVTLAALCSMSAAAQETERAQLFGGYSYHRLTPNSGGGLNLNGWLAGGEFTVKGPFAIASEVTGNHGKDGGANLRLYTVSAGPRFVHRAEKARMFGHVLLGGASLSASAAGISDRRWSFATTVGGGVDLDVSRSLALRVFQADYLMTRFGGNSQNNLRVSTGLVVRLGSAE
ncbi:MAG TPA: hypothetical protein VD837_01395 [Terriglobales bacterium]|nr:hypothetical protein [Terriglobales bacterium]